MTDHRGNEWGFADDREAEASPMTVDEYPQWFGTWQGRSMLAFKIMENLTGLYVAPEWEQTAQERHTARRSLLNG